MFTREPRIREAYLQTDRRLRLTVELHGRARLLTFTTPPIDLVAAPDEERAIDLDDGEEDGDLRFIAWSFVHAAAMNHERGGIADDVEVMPASTMDRAQVAVCTFGSPWERRR